MSSKTRTKLQNATSGVIASEGQEWTEGETGIPGWDLDAELARQRELGLTRPAGEPLPEPGSDSWEDMELGELLQFAALGCNWNDRELMERIVEERSELFLELFQREKWLEEAEEMAAATLNQLPNEGWAFRSWSAKDGERFFEALRCLEIAPPDIELLEEWLGAVREAEDAASQVAQLEASIDASSVDALHRLGAPGEWLNKFEHLLHSQGALTWDESLQFVDTYGEGYVYEE